MRLKTLKTLLISALLVTANAGATGMPPVDFSLWAKKTLKDNGITDARVVETQYPFSFTYCQQDSSTLWRYVVMDQAQIQALSQGKIAKPVTERTVAIEENSDACKAAG